MVAVTVTRSNALSLLTASRDNDQKEHLHMGDKGGKKDKAKSQQQHDVKQKAEAKRQQEKSPRKTS